MKALVIGKGVVGDATGYALEQRGHDVVYHDPPKGIDDSADGVGVALICVPTPRGALGYNSRSIVYRAADWLDAQSYTGLVGIRSTVVPGTCDELQAEFPAMTWFSWPEFLQAERAREMAMHPPYGVLGVPRDEDGVALPESPWLYLITGIVTKDGQGEVGNYTITTPTGAEFIKYATNCLLAGAVGIANDLADWADALGLDYNALVPPICEKDAILPSNVYRSDEGGFGGACLPKDLAAALFHASRDRGVDMPVLAAVHKANVERRPECYGGGGQ
jgi:UDP-glucose 6-dehydrogenase